MSCADVQTIKSGDGSKTQFSFDFPYLLKTEIKVYFWDDTNKEWDEKLTTDSTYPWQVTDANPTIVEFTSTAPPSPTAPDNVPNVRIRRVTNIDDIKALFNPGSAIRSDDLNNNFEQLRYAIQESNCQEVPAAIDKFVDDYYWNNYEDTVKSDDTWDSSDTKIATTAAMDARFQDEANETITSTETWVENDDTVPTTLAASNQYDTLVQTDTPSGSYAVGKTWLQNDDDKTLSIYDGTNWISVVSGGTFTNQPKVIYVDATAGDDNNNGHRISRPKRTIRAAIADINADDDNGDGSVVVVAPGIYAETFPIDIERNDVGIIGVSLRTCIIHPAIPADDQAGYDVDVPEDNELTTMFRVNSGSYFQNLTLTGMKASGARGGSGSLYENATYGLPVNQGWNFGFLPGATIRKSPYIQNCTNFSDSQINNVTFTPHTPGEGAAGDTDSAPTGGGILVDGSVPAENSPLRSMVCDSYTHTALDGPGIFVTNNGYIQATSSYAFFNHAHITCINGGQANLAASTTDFGRYGLLADGRSPQAIFTSNVDGAALDGATTFNINAPTASTDLYNEAGTDNDNDWFGSATRPQSNMLVEVNSVTYPVLSAVANTDSEGGAGWTVTISRPDPNNRSNNLGLNGALTDDAAVSFFLRSQIASSGHTMEYVGSGTNYLALPENGGVPDENDQKIELNNGKIWAATTDHNGKFTLGGNQTDDPFFEVDQQAGFVTIPEGSIAFNLLSDETPQLGGNLDVNGNEITSASNGNVVINPNGNGVISLDADVGIGTTAPGSADLAIVHARDALNFARVSIGQNVDGQGSNGGNHLGLWYGNADSDRADIFTSAGNMNFWVDGAADGTGQFTFGRTFNTTWMTIDDSGQVGVGTTSPSSFLHLQNSDATAFDATATDGQVGVGPTIYLENPANANNTVGGQIVFGMRGTEEQARISATGGTSPELVFTTADAQRMVIDNSGNVGVGTASPSYLLDISGSSPDIQLNDTDASGQAYRIQSTNGALRVVNTGVDERLRIDSDGRLLVGTNSTTQNSIAVFQGNNAGSDGAGIVHLAKGSTTPADNDFLGTLSFTDSGHVQAARVSAHRDGGTWTSGSSQPTRLVFSTTADGASSPTARMTIDNGGLVGIGTTDPNTLIDARGSGPIAQVTATDQTNARVRIQAGNTSSSYLEFGDSDDADVGEIVYDHSNNSMRFRTNGTPQVYIDSDGRLLVGTSTARAVGGESNPRLQIEGSGASSNSWMNLTRFANSTGGAFIQFGKSRSNTPGTYTVVQDDDTLGGIAFAGADGNDLGHYGATITAEVDGTPDSNEMPGRLVFSTNSGSASPTARMTITSEGLVGIGNTNPGDYSTVADDLVVGNLSGAHGITIAAENNNTAYLRFADGTANSGQQAAGQVAYSHADNSMRFNTVAEERVRIDSSGRLIVGAPTDITGSGASMIQAIHSGGGTLSLARNDTSVGADNALGQIRIWGNDSNGTYQECARISALADASHATGDKPTRLVFFVTEDGNGAPTERMRISNNGNVVFSKAGDDLIIGGPNNQSIYRDSSTRAGIHFTTAAVIATDGTGTVDDNAIDLGNSSFRWDDVYATNGTIQTSDQNLKQDVAQLTDAELAAAKAIRGLVKTYRWIDSVEEKGDNARIHVGVIAQEVEQAFIDQGLDPTRYALFCKNSWYAVDGRAMDDNGETYTEDTPGAVLVERRGVRYPQLLAFVMAAVDAEATAFEARLAALEAN